MPISLEGMVARLAKRPLPAMAITIRRVTYLLQDPNTSNLDLQKVIGMDPGFTLDIYRSFGSSATDSRPPASDVAHAISLLGPLPVKVAVKNLPTLDKNLPESARIGIYQCYSRAVHASVYAKHIGEIRRDKNPDEMGHAALLHSCGEMALWAHASKPMLEIYKLVQTGADWGSATHSVLGFTMKQLNTAMAKEWRLSPLITETTDHTWFGQSRSMAVQIACSIARESATGWNSSAVKDLLELLSDYLQHNKERTTAIIHSLAAQADRQIFGMPLPASSFNMLRQPPVTIIAVKKRHKKPTMAIAPRKKPQKAAGIEMTPRPAMSKKAPCKPALVELLKQMPQKQHQEVNPASSKPDTDSKPVSAKPAPQPATKPETKSEPKGPEETQILEPTPTQKPVIDKPAVPPKVTQKSKIPSAWEENMHKYMRKMRNDIGLQRIMFVLISPSRKYAKVSEVKGADANSGLHNFIVNIEEQNLFKLLLAKQQGFWLKPENRERSLPMIPQDLIDSGAGDGFFCMSIFVRGEAAGFVYADGKHALNDKSYADFKQLCAELSMALSSK